MSCPECFEGYTLPGEPKGHIEIIGGLSVYVVDPTTAGYAGNDHSRTDVAVIYLADAFGLGLVNSKIISDRLSSALGCTVYAPDILEGDYPPQSLVTIDKPMAHKSIFFKMTQYLKLIWGFLWSLGPRWLLRHSRGKTQPLAEAFTRSLREEKKLNKICAIGYCMGGILTCALAGEGLIEVAVIAHPGPITPEDFDKVKVPISFICAQEDFAFSDKARDGAEAIFKRNDVPHEVRIYPGTTHGFACRPNMSIPGLKQAFEDAIDQAISWMKVYLIGVPLA